ncbi:hypothetical protein [Stappia sp.]|uniref:hypothetical protein n=1 Tax=Stappia sp. TaxID=1870903 RepID=UPI003D0C0BFB
MGQVRKAFAATFVVFAVAAAIQAGAVPGARADTGGIETVHARSAGPDLDAVRRDVGDLAVLAQKHIGEAGLRQALKDFSGAPWVRDANGLHLWGVTVSGVSWFDTGHPELVGIDVSNITDIEGRFWAKLAVQSALGTGDKVFLLLFPHPKTGKSAVGFHSCFALEDGERVLCAGAFEDASR